MMLCSLTAHLLSHLLKGHGPVPVCGPGFGDHWFKGNKGMAELVAKQGNARCT